MLPILLAVTGVSYVYGRVREKQILRQVQDEDKGDDLQNGKGLLAGTIVLLLLPLLAFKYLDFLMDSTADMLSLASLNYRDVGL